MAEKKMGPLGMSHMSISGFSPEVRQKAEQLYVDGMNHL